MFIVIFSETIKQQLIAANIQHTAVGASVQELQHNPYKNAIRLNIPRMPEYYMDTGNFCLLFDIDTEAQKVEIKYVKPSPEYLNIINSFKTKSE